MKDMPKGRNLQRKIYQNDRTLFIRVVRPRASFPNILKRFWDFPGGTVDKNPPANAGDRGFDPQSRKIPHATEQLSPCTTTIETAPGPTTHNY